MIACVLYVPDCDQSRYWSDRVRAYLTEHDHDVIMIASPGPDANLARLQRENRKPYPLDFPDPQRQIDYRRNLENPAVVGCFYTHYDAWQISAQCQDPVMIFEDDVIFYRDYHAVDFDELLVLVLQDRVRSDTVDRPNKIREKQFWRKHYLESPQQPAQAVPYHPPWPRPLGSAAGYAIRPQTAQNLLDTFREHYMSADRCVGPDFVKVQVHNHLMGRAAIESDGKIARDPTWTHDPVARDFLEYR